MLHETSIEAAPSVKMTDIGWPARWNTKEAGPVYPRMAALDKHRADANGDRPDRGYGAAVLAAIRSLNRCAKPQPLSLRSTAWIPAAHRAMLRARLEVRANTDRARRSDEEIIAQYHAHMKKQRALQELI